MKKRQEHKKLVEAGKEARQLLVDRKLILPKEKSIIETIANTPGAPKLPGQTQSYLPRYETIVQLRRMMARIVRIYFNELKERGDDKLKHGTEFFKFALEELNKPKSKINDLIVKTVNSKEYNQSLLSKKETLDAIIKFFVDSFAVSVICKSHTDVVDYIIWFDSWSESLMKYWPQEYEAGKNKIENEKTDNSG